MATTTTQNEEEEKNSPRDDDVSWAVGQSLFIFLFILYTNNVL
jgi:hypothetical protein